MASFGIGRSCAWSAVIWRKTPEVGPPCAALVPGPARGRGAHLASRPSASESRAGVVCQVRVVNIAEAVDLHELIPADRPDWYEGKAVYEQSLELFEGGDFGPAARLLGNWRARHADDGPALVLMYRAVRCMVEGAPASHPVWVLPEK